MAAHDRRGWDPPPAPLAVDDRGNALVSFVRDPEDMPPDDAPTPFAPVALRRRDRVLMVFNRYRRAGNCPEG
ncbi:hypothetical protein ACIBCM_34445 [Streptomyces sp. NPDC051018]|uniref:hypothetical protein n=1 Tax=Streptomyces sp. NPDC051018 TaxID=3365639 RepID=UPI003795995A